MSIQHYEEKLTETVTSSCIVLIFSEQKLPEGKGITNIATEHVKAKICESSSPVQ